MTQRAQGKEWAEKVVAEESFYEPSIARSVVVVDDVVKLIRKQHARAVRICKRIEKNAVLKQAPDCDRCYLQGVRDILTALQRGRGGKG